jgi:hypothetical protein
MVGSSLFWMLSSATGTSDNPLLEGQGSDAVRQRAIFSPVRIESVCVVVVLIMDSDSMFVILLVNILTWSRAPDKTGVALRLASQLRLDSLDDILLQLVERSILLPGKPSPPQYTGTVLRGA